MDVARIAEACKDVEELRKAKTRVFIRDWIAVLKIETERNSIELKYDCHYANELDLIKTLNL